MTSYIAFKDSNERDAAWLAEAVEFTATVCVMGEVITHRATTQAEAVEAARQMEATLAAQQIDKKVLIYAVTAKGHSTMVPRKTWNV